MKKAHPFIRGVTSCLIWIGALLASPAFPSDRSLDVVQYAHTSWKIREGFAKGAIQAIAQTPDGYLWLGTEFGLLRFDGVRAVPWQPPAGQSLPSSNVDLLVASRDGALWIGTWNGLASWKDGKLTQYPELAGLLITALFEDSQGIVSAGGFSFTQHGKLCSMQNGSFECHGQDGTFGNGVVGLYQDSKGELWAGTLNGLWRWKPGPPRFYPVAGELNGIQALTQDGNGTVLIAMRGRVARFAEGKFSTAYPYPPRAQQAEPGRVLRDRDGGLWIGTGSQGLIHVHHGNVDGFGAADGLSGDNVVALFQDREGSVWIGTTKGLDRFTTPSVETFSEQEGLSTSADAAVLAATDGTVWFNTQGRLSRWDNKQITVYHEPGARSALVPPPTGQQLREITVNGLPKHDLVSLFQDSDGRIWITGNGGAGYLQGDRFISAGGVPGGIFYAISGDTQGNLWMSHLQDGIFHISHGALVQRTPWAALGRNDFAASLAVDPSQGGLWLGFSKGGLAFLKDGQIRASYSHTDGLGEGRVNDLHFDEQGALWIATDGGLSRSKNGHIATIGTNEGLPCERILWLVEDKDRSLWLYGPCGLIRIPASELDARVGQEGKGPRQPIHATVFDSSDGVRPAGDPGGGPEPRPSKSPDGEIWFPTSDGLSVVDPRHLVFNEIPPPVYVEQVAADRKTYDTMFNAKGSLSLPAHIRDLEIDYTALSFVAPEKVRFRYKLEGRDTEWQDAGTRRQAFYSDLSPRKYRFRVAACNNSGIWNEAGAFLDFSIAPAYYQTGWFLILCVAAFLSVLWAIYQYRLRQMERQFTIGFEARVSERLRIARELHDTLLQSLQGLLLRFQTASNLLPTRPGEAKEKLDDAIDLAALAVTEGRSAVQGLRASATLTNELQVALSALAKELAGNGTSQGSPTFTVDVEGEPRELHPLLRDEVYRIAGEALRNAFKHAEAKQIEVEIHYDASRLRLRIRDNGKGIAQDVVQGDGRTGHWGLHGMRERAKIIGGNLEVWSSLQSGTEVELTIPASVAYATAKIPRRS